MAGYCGPGIALAMLALGGLLIGCDLATVPSPTPMSEAPAPSATSAGPPVASCERDAFIFGVVIERTPAGVQPVADAVLSGRFPPAAFDPAAAERTDANGRYRFCRAVPEAACSSGACSLPFEVRASKEGYTTATTMVTVTYDAWWFNDFAAPDLELTRE